MPVYKKGYGFRSSSYYEGTKKDVVAYLKSKNLNFLVGDLILVKPKKITSETAAAEQKKGIARQQRVLKKTISKCEEDLTLLAVKMDALKEGRPSKKTPTKKKKPTTSRDGKS